MAGIQPFEVRDELYVSELHPPLEVLLHTRFTGECRGFAEGHVTDDEPRPVLYLRRSGARHGLLFHARSLPRPLRRAGPRQGGSRPPRLRQLGGSRVPHGTRAVPAWAVTGEFPQG